MPSRDLDAVFFIGRPPTITFREGMFHICYDIGKRAAFELVMSPNTFLRARKAGAQAVSAFEAGDAKIVALPKH